MKVKAGAILQQYKEGLTKFVKNAYGALDGKDLISALKAIKVGEDITEETLIESHDLYPGASIKILAFGDHIPGGGYDVMKVLDMFIRDYSSFSLFKDSPLISELRELESEIIGNQSYES